MYIIISKGEWIGDKLLCIYDMHFLQLDLYVPVISLKTYFSVSAACLGILPFHNRMVIIITIIVIAIAVVMSIAIVFGNGNNHFLSSVM